MKKVIFLLIFSLLTVIKISAATFTVTSNSDAGPGTLRQAILDANALAGANDIIFAIGSGPKTITLLSVVDITTAINIDGSTQPGFSGIPLIKIAGTSMFTITNANGATVQYLDFSGNSSSIAILANSISNCFINNNVITGVSFAIRINGDNSNNQISNNNFSGAGQYGVLFAMGANDGNIITNNNLTNCGAWGLFYGLGTPASIDNNDFTGCANALFIGGSNNLTLTSPSGTGPNKNMYGSHSGRVLDLLSNTNLKISDWDFTSLVLPPLNTRIPLHVNNSISNIFSNCNLAGMQNGIQFYGDNTNDTIKNCDFSGSAQKGIWFYGGTNQGNVIINNNVSNCGDFGLYYDSGTPSIINNNNFIGSVNGLYLKSANTFTLGSNNTFKNQTGISIDLEMCNAVNISNIATNGSGGHGIYINQSDNCVINGNSSCGRLYGIRILNSSNMNSLLNCSIVSCTNGIELADVSVNNTIIDNANLFNTTNIINNGTNTIITNTTSVNTSPLISVNSGSICTGNSFTITPSGAITYTFSSGSAVVSPTISSSYSVVGTDANGCKSSLSAVSTISVYTTPILAVNSGVICSGQSFTMTPTVLNGPPVSYTYSSGSSIVTPTSNATYSITATSNKGCVSSNTAISSVTVNALPIVSVNSGAICSGESYTMTPSGTADTYSYSNGSDVVMPTADASYTVTGTNTVTGCSNTAVSSVTVNALPIILVNSGAICIGSSFTMMPTGADTYTYSSGNAIVSPTADASYNITGTSAQGCLSSNIAVSSVTVNTLPTVLVNSGVICSGESFTMSPTGADTYIYSNGSDVATPTADASYTVTGTDVNGCENTAVSSVTVNALPAVSVNSGAICSGESFTMTPAGADTYIYSNGSDVTMPSADESYTVTGTNTLTGCSNTAVSSLTVNALPTVMVNSGSICTGSSFTMMPTGADTYTYSNGSDITMPTADESYTVTGTNTVTGCSNTAVSSLTVNALPTVSVNSGVICAGESFTMMPTGATTYAYSNGSDVAMPTADATYTVTGTNTVTGCSNTAVSSLTVNALPTVIVNSGSICSGSSFTMMPTGADTYTYSNGNDVAMPTADATYTVTGTNTVTGCSNTAISSVTVNALPIVLATTNNTLLCIGETATLSVSGASTYTWSTAETTVDIAVSPTSQTTYTVEGTDESGCVNTTTIMQDVSLCTGVNQIASVNNDLMVYPNPSNGTFNVSISTLTKIIVLDVLGKVVYAESFEAGKSQIDLHQQADGIYFLKAESNGNSKTIRLIKD